MSESVIELSKQLNKEILESDEYKKLRKYKKDLDKYPELRNSVQEFRKKNFQMHIENTGEDMTAAMRLEGEYKELLSNPLVTAYLNAELNFCRIAQKVSKNICRDIDIDLDFL